MKGKTSDYMMFKRLKRGLEEIGMTEMSPDEVMNFRNKRSAIPPKSARIPKTHDQVSFVYTRRQLQLKIRTAFNPTLKDNSGTRRGMFAKGCGSIKIIVEDVNTGHSVIYKELWKRGDFIDRVLIEAGALVRVIENRPRCRVTRKFMKLSVIKGIAYWRSPLVPGYKMRIIYFIPPVLKKFIKDKESAKRYYLRIRKTKLHVKKTRRQIVKKWKKKPLKKVKK